MDRRHFLRGGAAPDTDADRSLGIGALEATGSKAASVYLHWSSSHKAGVSFELPLSIEECSAWVEGRAELTPLMRRLTIADITDLAA